MDKVFGGELSFVCMFCVSNLCSLWLVTSSKRDLTRWEEVSSSITKGMNGDGQCWERDGTVTQLILLDLSVLFNILNISLNRASELSFGGLFFNGSVHTWKTNTKSWYFCYGIFQGFLLFLLLSSRSTEQSHPVMWSEMSALCWWHPLCLLSIWVCWSTELFEISNWLGEN